MQIHTLSKPHDTGRPTLSKVTWISRRIGPILKLLVVISFAFALTGRKLAEFSN